MQNHSYILRQSPSQAGNHIAYGMESFLQYIESSY